MYFRAVNLMKWTDRSLCSRLDHWSGLSQLESRVFLSASEMTDDAITINWNDQNVMAYENSWIVSADQFSEASVFLEGLESVRTGDILSVSDLGEGLFQLETADAYPVEKLESTLSTKSGFNYLEPDMQIQVMSIPDDTRFDELWGLHNTGQTGGTADADIDAVEAWSLADSLPGNEDVIVAVIDTGINYLHSDLAANMWTNPGEIDGDGIDNDGNGFIDDYYGYDFVNNDGDPMDDHRHGTHVAGTIGAIGNNNRGVIGVNPNAKMMGLKFLGANGSGSSSNAVRAVNYMTMMKRDHGINIRLSNNSWGGGAYSQALADAIAENADQDILFVAAAGNHGNNLDNYNYYPAEYEHVIPVAATNHNDNKAGFSGYGVNTVQISAPGVNILSTVLGNGYSSFNGTSMAAPHVSGALSLLLSEYPDLLGQNAAEILYETADQISQLSSYIEDGARLNAFEMLNALTDTPENQAPIAMALTSTQFDENLAGATVGTLQIVDPDLQDVFQLSVDHEDFEFSGNTLKLKDHVSFDYESTPTVDVEVTVVDSANHVLSKTFTLHVQNFLLPIEIVPETVRSAVLEGQDGVETVTLNNIHDEDLRYHLNLSDTADWLSFDNPSGLILQDSSVVLQLNINTSLLAPGSHYTSFTVESEDVDEPGIVVPVNLEVLEDAPRLQTGLAYTNSDDWTRVYTSHYIDPVIVATPINTEARPVVARIREVDETSFDIKLQTLDSNPEEIFNVFVQWVIAEAGVYTEAEHGIQMEAVKFESDKTAGKGRWNQVHNRSYTNTYNSPVVLGQVMSDNDENFSTFFAHGSSRGQIPDSNHLKVGKHVGEDPNTTRVAETLGYMVIEAGTGSVPYSSGFGVQSVYDQRLVFEAGVTSDSVRGVDNGSYQFNTEFESSAILTMAGVDGGDGGFAVFDEAPWYSNQLSIAIDEDQLGDNERAHTTEQVAYFALRVANEIEIEQVASYQFYSSANPGEDSSNWGSDNSGTAVGDVTAGHYDPSAGYRSYADFNGGHIHIPDSVDINTAQHEARTIALWFKADSTNGRQVLYEEGGATRGLNIYIDNGLLYVGGWNRPSNESNWAGTYLSTAAPNDGEWHHVALTLQGNGNELVENAFVGYLDGIEFGRGAGSKLWSHSDDGALGAVVGTTRFHDDTTSSENTAYYGFLSEVRIINRELTADDIADLARLNRWES